jgi:hypothetical protein
MTDYERGYEQGKADATKKMHPEIRALYEDYFDKCFKEYKADAQKQWVGLTDEDLVDCESEEDVRFVRAIEAKLKEKNGG